MNLDGAYKAKRRCEGCQPSRGENCEFAALEIAWNLEPHAKAGSQRNGIFNS